MTRWASGGGVPWGIMSDVDQLHRTIAYAAVAGTLLALGWTVAVLVTGRGGGQRLESLQSAVVGIVALGAVVGLVLLLTGHAPNDPIHLLYGFLVVAAIPFARSFGPRVSPHGRVVLGLVGLIAVGLFLLRLFMTG
jgi:hypothetical protein